MKRVLFILALVALMVTPVLATDNNGTGTIEFCNKHCSEFIGTPECPDQTTCPDCVCNTSCPQCPDLTCEGITCDYDCPDCVCPAAPACPEVPECTTPEQTTQDLIGFAGMWFVQGDYGVNLGFMNIKWYGNYGIAVQCIHWTAIP